MPTEHAYLSWVAPIVVGLIALGFVGVVGFLIGWQAGFTDGQESMRHVVDEMKGSKQTADPRRI